MGIVIGLVDGKDYVLPDSLGDIPLGLFVECVSKVEPNMPKMMREWIMIEGEEERKEFIRGVKDVEYGRWIKYMASWVSVYLRCDKNMLLGKGEWKGKTRGLKVEEIEWMYWHLMGLFGSWKYDDSIEYFEYRDERWCFPKKYMEGSTVGEFMEAAQFEDYAKELAGGKWNEMGNVLGVIFRKEGESYDEDIVERRGRMFMKDLGVDVALWGAFFLMSVNRKYVIDFQIYTIARRLGQLKQGLSN